MELICELLFQLLGEVILQLVLQMGFRGLAKPFQKASYNTYWLAVWCFFAGAIAGGLSLLMLPQHLMPNMGFRAINLFVTPCAVGACMNLLGNIRKKRDLSTLQIDSFLFGFLFAFAMALVRFIFAK
jgi:hypothetical protein